LKYKQSLIKTEIWRIKKFFFPLFDHFYFPIIVLSQQAQHLVTDQGNL